MQNVEFKARRSDHDDLIKKIHAYNPRYIGEDHQVDTYFNVKTGRLKLREGNIENALIYYHRDDVASAKLSQVILYQHPPSQYLKEILTAVHGVKVIVNKKRKIYFIDNVKFHFDVVEELGSFVEVEAIESNEKAGIEKIQEQCNFFASLLGILNEEFLPDSYSDMLLNS
ncbi:MAG: class IV adenylate cyclase [Ferruginibacter sp.]